MGRRSKDIVLSDDEVYPWEKLPEESEKAYAAFKVFMDLSIDAMPGDPEYRCRVNVAKKMGYRHIHPIQEWSSKFRWQERVNAIDEWEMRLIKAAELKEKIEMRKRHLKLAQGVQKVGEAKLKNLLDEIESGVIPEIDCNTLYKLIESAVKLEQLSAGIGDGENTTGKIPVTRIEIIIPEKFRKVEEADEATDDEITDTQHE